MPTQIVHRSSEYMALAAPDEQFKIRLLIRAIQNPRPYTKNGTGNAIYQFEWDERLGLHVLDIPLSVWMARFVPRSLQNTLSLPYELLGRPCAHAPIITIVEPIGAIPERKDETGEKLGLFSELLTRIGAPEALVQAVGKIQSGSLEEFREFVETVAVDEPEKRSVVRRKGLTKEQREEIKREQARVRMQKKRDRDAAKNTEPAAV